MGVVFIHPHYALPFNGQIGKAVEPAGLVEHPGIKRGIVGKDQTAREQDGDFRMESRQQGAFSTISFVMPCRSVASRGIGFNGLIRVSAKTSPFALMIASSTASALSSRPVVSVSREERIRRQPPAAGIDHVDPN